MYKLTYYPTAHLISTMPTSKPVVLRFKFDGFEYLPCGVDQVFESDMKTDANGHCWKLQLYPGGCSDSIEDGMVAVILINVGDADVVAKFTVTARNSVGQAVLRESDQSFHLFTKLGRRGFGYGYSDTRFMKRDRILDLETGILVDGSLHIDVAIEVQPQKEELYYPVAPLVPNMLRLLESGQDSDVSFRINDKILKAHLLVLRTNAPFLADQFHEQHEKEDNMTSKVVHERLVVRRHSLSFGCSIAPITKSEPYSLVVNSSVDVFQLFLRYVYAGALPDDETMLRMGTRMIEVSHQFHVHDLKMLAENALVRACVVNNKNVVDYLLFAEANNCAMLKEYAMNYFVIHVEDVLTSKNTKKLQEVPELMKEVLFAVARKGDEKTMQQSPFRTMTVAEMRKELASQGSSVYGSKDVLISRLEGSS